MSYLLCRSFMGVCKAGVYIRDLKYSSYIGVAREGIIGGDLWYPTEKSSKNVLQKCQKSMSNKSILQMSRKNIFQIY